MEGQSDERLALGRVLRFNLVLNKRKFYHSTGIIGKYCVGCCGYMLNISCPTGVAHKKLLSQVEGAVEIQLNDAQRKITATHEASICYKYYLYTVALDFLFFYLNELVC